MPFILVRSKTLSSPKIHVSRLDFFAQDIDWKQRQMCCGKTIFFSAVDLYVELDSSRQPGIMPPAHDKFFEKDIFQGDWDGTTRTLALMRQTGLLHVDRTAGYYFLFEENGAVLREICVRDAKAQGVQNQVCKMTDIGKQKPVDSLRHC